MDLQPAAGWKGWVIITDANGGSSPLCADEWDWDGNVDALPVPTFCSDGYYEYAAGMVDLDLMVTGPWNFEFNPFAGPPAVQLGGYYGVKLYVDFNGHPEIVAEAPSALCVHANVNDKATDVSRYTFNFKGGFKFTDFSGNEARAPEAAPPA